MDNKPAITIGIIGNGKESSLAAKLLRDATGTGDEKQYLKPLPERRIIVAGSRGFSPSNEEREKFFKLLDGIIFQRPMTEERVIIISGGAKGADKFGETYAIDRKLGLEIMPAKWKIEDINTWKGPSRYNEHLGYYDPTAGHKRNAEMAKVADEVILFWDGKSKGTKGMYDEAIRRELPVVTVNYPKIIIEYKGTKYETAN